MTSPNNFIKPEEERLIGSIRKAAISMLFFMLIFSFAFIYYVYQLTAPQTGKVQIAIAEEQGPQLEILDGKEVSTGLIADEGLELVMGNCLGCHSSMLITQNRMDRDTWKATIRWMQETQKLHDLGEQESIILDYLAKNYSPQGFGRRKALENIEWYELTASNQP